MQIEDQQLKSFLLGAGLASLNDLEKASKESSKNGKKLEDVLIEKKIVSQDKINKLKAYILGIPFADLEKEDIPREIIEIIPEPVARKYQVVAFQKKGEELRVAMIDPSDLQILDFIRKKTGFKIIPCLTTEESIKYVLKQYQKSLEAEFGDIIQDKGLEEGKEFTADKTTLASKEKKGEGQDLKKAAEDLPVIKIVDTLLKHAIVEGASDVHIEPEEKDVVARYRIDGILHDAMTLPLKVLPGIVARIKILANLKIDEHRLPQDGRFKIKTSDYKVAFRVSVLPVFDGEKIVLRLLNESAKKLTLEQIGFSERNLKVVKSSIKKPNGMILVTGPTGSGKTTTLYTILSILNIPEVNISTLEDPVEYRMSRINQTQINPKIGLTFASGLRTLLRQDPDIIMVGEIRDRETAEMAIHSALTGHLVLSTLHTNSAAGTLPRLLEMGIESFLLASTTNVIIAQRLVRKICPDCKKGYRLNKTDLEKLSEQYDLETVANILKERNIIKEKNGDYKKALLDLEFFKGEGCGHCHGRGYRGRIGVFEAMEITDEIKMLLGKGSGAELLEREAIKEGMITIVQDGFIKAAQGITSIEEVMRVTKE